MTFRTAGACLLGLALLRPALAQSNKLPRTPEGKPDLQGIWQVRNRKLVSPVPGPTSRRPEGR